MSVAIITGASSGLGAEYARALRALRPDIDTYWLIARRTDRLEAMKKELPGIKIESISLDLTKESCLTALADKLEKEKPDVALLVNNAGRGKLGEFSGQPWRDQADTVELNNTALTAVTSMALPHMQRGSAIVNVCSIAAFVPTARMTVYCSTKAFVMSFSRALRHELKGRGINVLAACPGPMETEFLPLAGIEKGKSASFDWLPRVNPTRMAEKSLKAAFAGRAVYTDKTIYKLYRVVAKLLPHAWLLKFTAT